MEITVLTRLKNELESFKLITTASMIGAALTIAYSITFGFTEIIPLLIGSPIETDYLPYLLVVISGFATAFSWITRSAELMDSHNEIVKELNNIISESKSETNIKSELDESIISIIVKSLAFYRENSSKINKLKWIGRLTGAFLLVTGIPQLISFLNGTYPVGSLYVLAQGFFVASSIGISIVSWYVPVLIKRYMDTWDTKLKLAEDASIQLGKMLEGSL